MHASHTQRIEELLIWRVKPGALGGEVGHGGSFCVTGPVVGKSSIVAHASRPDLLWAARKDTGELSWSRSFGRIARVLSGGVLLYVYVDSELFCLNEATGATSWQTRTGKSIIGMPFLTGNRIYWATAGGVVTCADAGSGHQLWSRRAIERTFPGITVAGRTLVISQDRMATGLDAWTGDAVWSRELPGRPLRRPRLGFGGVLVRLTDQLLLLSPADGSTLATWTWPGSRTGHLATGDSAVFVVVCDPDDALVVGPESARGRGCRALRLGQAGSILWELAMPARSPRIVWDDGSNWLVEASGGVGLVDVGSGRREYSLLLPGVELLLTPAVEHERIYVTTVEGELICFRVPTQTSTAANRVGVDANPPHVG